MGLVTQDVPEGKGKGWQLRILVSRAMQRWAGLGSEVYGYSLSLLLFFIAGHLDKDGARPLKMS